VIELLSLPYSPWSEKARWALDHHGVRYEEVEYVPILGEPALRKRLGKWSGKISIPMLITGDGVLVDSLRIAKYAEEIGSDPLPLFPAALASDIETWNARSESAMAAGRAIVTGRVLRDPAAKREAMPPMPKALTSIVTGPLTRLAVTYLRRKYRYSATVDAQQATLVKVVSELRNVLADGRPFVLGDAFSYADICMASALQCVRPVTDEFLKIGPATRKAWTDDALASEYSDLLDWRDQIYESHRH